MERGQRVYDRWWPWRVGVIVRVLKTRLYVRWTNGECSRYDKAHQQFLEAIP